MKYITDLTITEILNEYDHYEIFKLIFNEIPDLDQVYLSPFRKDNNPNCYFIEKDKLYFVDWADGKTRNCFVAIMEFFNLSISETCTFIVKNLKKTSKTPYHNILKKDKSTILIPIYRKWEERDKSYWYKQYNITIEQLEEDNVYPIKAVYVNNNVYSIDDAAYAIKLKDNVYKIYRPYQSKKFKWLSNASPNDIIYYNYPKDHLVITKSYKDCRILRNLGYCAIWFQNEGAFPSDLSYILSFNKIIVFFDNDDAGIHAANKLIKLINKKCINISSPILYIKDLGEMWTFKGPEYTINFLNASILGTDNK